MGDGPHLLRKILERPDDDVVRLIYADWLDEQGQHNRAEFVRVQIRLMGIVSAGKPHSHAVGCPRRGLYRYKFSRDDPRMPDCEKCQYQRLLDVYTDNKGRWRKILGFHHPDVKASVRRGFVSAVWLTMDQFHQHAGELFAVHPIEQVTVTDADRLVYPSSGNSTYYLAGLGRFTQPYWNRLDSHWSRRAVLDALAAVCVEYGRELAGLPPLTTATAVDSPARPGYDSE